MHPAQHLLGGEVDHRHLVLLLDVDVEQALAVGLAKLEVVADGDGPHRLHRLGIDQGQRAAVAAE